MLVAVEVLLFVGAIATIVWVLKRSNAPEFGDRVLEAFDRASMAQDDEAVVALEAQALATARASNPVVRGVILHNTGRALVRLGRTTEARGRLDAALLLAPDKGWWIDVASFAGICAQRLGDQATARSLCEQSIKAFEEGSRSENSFLDWSHAHLNLAELDYRSGDPDSGEHHVAAALEIAAASGDNGVETACVGGVVELYLFCGDVDRAETAYVEVPGDPYDETWQTNWMRAFLLFHHAELSALSGDTGEADRALAAATRFAGNTEGRPMDGDIAHNVGRVAYVRGSYDDAYRELTSALDWYDAHEQYNISTQVASDLARAAVEAGRPDAPALLADAIERNERFGFTADVARLRALR